MIRPAKVRAVMTFEFLSEIRRVSYLIMVFGMPIFLLAYGALISGITWFSKKSEEAVRVYGVVDPGSVLALSGDVSRSTIEIPPEARQAAGMLGSDLRQIDGLGLFPGIVFRPLPDEAAARAALRDKTIKGWFQLDRDYLESGAIDIFLADAAGLNTGEARRAMSSLIQERLLADRLPEALAERVRAPMKNEKSWFVTASGEVTPRSKFSIIARFAVPFVFMILLFISVFGTATSLIQGTAVEKENRVVDVLLSSATSDEILTGKLLGLGASGLIQVVVWFGMAGVAGLLFAGTLAAAGIEIPWGAIVVGCVFFVAGYLFLGSLMLGTGALGNTFKEAQQWSMIWTLMTAMPMAFMAILMNEPHGVMARVLTFIPFSAPAVVVFRMSMDPKGIAWWEVAGALVVLALSIWAALQIGARLFRVGLLLTGGRIKLREVIRQARLSR